MLHTCNLLFHFFYFYFLILVNNGSSSKSNVYLKKKKKSNLLVPVWIALILAFASLFCVILFFFFFSLVQHAIVDWSIMNSASMHYSQVPKLHSTTFLLKMSLITLFTYLKIISLQYFQFQQK